LQAREDLTTWNIDRGTAGGFKDFTPQTGNPHLDPLKIAEAVNFFIKPASHLGARITARNRDEVEPSIQLFPKGHAATMQQPTVHLLG
jgi:hypothetical protein